MSRARVAVLISGNGSNLQALLDACALPDYPAEIALVISNKPDAFGLTRATNAGVPTKLIEHTAYPSRAAFDEAVQHELLACNIDYVCLAGFMRLLTPAFTLQWTGRMLNIHPSLLPAFTGLHTHQRALEEGVKFSGCTVHFVTPDLDAGPIVMQAVVPLLQADNVDTLQQRIHAQEHVIYPLALRALASGQVRLEGKRALIASAKESAASLINPCGYH